MGEIGGEREVEALADSEALGLRVVWVVRVGRVEAEAVTVAVGRRVVAPVAVVETEDEGESRGVMLPMDTVAPGEAEVPPTTPFTARPGGIAGRHC